MLFLAKFCRGRDTHLGSWNATQSRSYFAVQLKDNWWVLGYDSQLGEDIDGPQAGYFVQIARQMKPGARIVICASVPSWLHADQDAKDPEGRDAFYKGLDYIANLLRNEAPEGTRVPLVLSGDLHHYSRFVAAPSGTNFITAGGGGAFHSSHAQSSRAHFRELGENGADRWTSPGSRMIRTLRMSVIRRAKKAGVWRSETGNSPG